MCGNNNSEHNEDMGFSARYTSANTDGKYSFKFFCALCDYGYVAEPVPADSVGEALQAAVREARPFFSACSQCGKWVCDYHYNMQSGLCTGCAPLEANCEQLAYLQEQDGKP